MSEAVTEQPVLVEKDGAVTVVTLNRPDRLNAFNLAQHEALRKALAASEADGTRCLLLTGAGRGFCAGQDLSDRKAEPDGAPPDLGESLEKRYNPLVRRLRNLPFPVLCAVNGVAAGAGCNLALAADIVIAARTASFVQSTARIGLIPDSGGTWMLPRLVGMARATALAMLGDKLPAEQAAQWGLIWKVVDDAALMDEARDLARTLASRPTLGLALTKRALRASLVNDLDAQLDLERDLQRIAGRSDDYREGVAAFLEKRDPVYRGR